MRGCTTAATCVLVPWSSAGEVSLVLDLHVVVAGRVVEVAVDAEVALEVGIDARVGAVVWGLGVRKT